MKQNSDKYWPIIGHQNIVKYLQNCLSKHQFAHAYLFAGPAHVGKSTVADIFIESLLCLEYQSGTKIVSSPCAKCQSCQHWQKDIHPDYFYLQLLDDKKSISIEQVRDWQRILSHKSFLTKYKVGAIIGAEYLTLEAANALLKTIEEPVGNTIIVLITDDYHLLLPTIISRSQIIKFGLVADQVIYDYLQTTGVNRQEAKLITQLARGLPGMALQYANSKESLITYQDSIISLIDLLQQPTHQRLDFIQAKLKGLDHITATAEVKQLMDRLLLVMRELILIKYEVHDWQNLELYQKELINLSKKYSWRQINQLLDKVFNWQNNLTYNPNPLLFAEDLLLTI